MKNYIKNLFVALALASAPNAALAIDDLYAGAGLAVEGVTDLEYGVALVLNVGAQVVDNFAVEGELTRSVIDPWLDDYYAIDVTVTTLGVYGAYIFDLNRDVYLKPRIGLIYKGLEDGYRGDLDEVVLAFSLGGAYRMNKTTDIFVDVKVAPEGDIEMVGHLSVGARYHF